jgi:hypothetical protein
MNNDDKLWSESTGKVDWHGGSYAYNWRAFIGPQTRGIWHSLTAEQKFALAKDALVFAQEADEEIWDNE